MSSPQCVLMGFAFRASADSSTCKRDPLRPDDTFFSAAREAATCPGRHRANSYLLYHLLSAKAALRLDFQPTKATRDGGHTARIDKSATSRGRTPESGRVDCMVASYWNCGSVIELMQLPSGLTPGFDQKALTIVAGQLPGVKTDKNTPCPVPGN